MISACVFIRRMEEPGGQQSMGLQRVSDKVSN